MTMHQQGKYVVLEGTDLSGKSTMVQLIHAWLSERNIPSIVAAQPGSTELGALLRQVVKHDKKIKIGKRSEAMMFALDHMAFCEEILNKTIDSGTWVISDRHDYISAMVYQALNGVDIGWLASLYTAMNDAPEVDAIFILHAPLDVLAKRAEKRNDGKWDRYESNTEFMKRVHDRYENLAPSLNSGMSGSILGHPQIFSYIDASLDKDKVFASIVEHLKRLCIPS